MPFYTSCEPFIHIAEDSNPREQDLRAPYTWHIGGLVLERWDEASYSSEERQSSQDALTQLHRRLVPILYDVAGPTKDIVRIVDTHRTSWASSHV